jgi:hypothetical protein
MRYEKMLRNYRVATQLVAFRVVPSSTELVTRVMTQQPILYFYILLRVSLRFLFLRTTQFVTNHLPLTTCFGL